jgi:hypothetical protein
MPCPSHRPWLDHYNYIWRSSLCSFSKFLLSNFILCMHNTVVSADSRNYWLNHNSLLASPAPCSQMRWVSVLPIMSETLFKLCSFLFCISHWLFFIFVLELNLLMRS